MVKQKDSTSRPEVALVGDSILDNWRYVKRGQCVGDLLHQRLQNHALVHLLAQDGSLTGDLSSQQLEYLDREIFTHVVLSTGGNDALACLPHLGQPVSTMTDALSILSSWQTDFRRRYREVMESLQRDGFPVLVFTIYEAVPGLPQESKTALSLFNDVITREALRMNFDLLDLRELLNEPDDFSGLSRIEPSEKGGSKLASVIADWVLHTPFVRKSSSHKDMD